MFAVKTAVGEEPFVSLTSQSLAKAKQLSGYENEIVLSLDSAECLVRVLDKIAY